ncbi:MAG: family 43 glycosylhydrolase [Acidimicrobiaceae bacterium]|nr:family 43 glycosylhydrolase [Acidimicrobiaceae bacterium]
MSARPVDRKPFPDPFVLRVADGYYAYGTNGNGANVQVMFSPNLRRWRRLPDALPTLPGWAAPHFTWSPVVLARPEGYVLYYAVRDRRRNRQAISVATSADPAGPFIDVSTEPFIYQFDLGGSIDPSTFIEVDGSAHLLWKADSNAIRQPSTLWIGELSGDGLGLGPPARLLVHDAAWEEPLIEAPCLVNENGVYYLFYSAGRWNTDRYSIGYATATNRLGPYEKQTADMPWFISDGQVAGPGGQELFVDHEGGWRMAYHGWKPGQVGRPGAGRTLRIMSVSLASGRPEVLG